MVLLNLSKLLHSEVRGYWNEKLEEKLKRATLRKRWEEIDKPHEAKAELSGDVVLKQMRTLLDTGFGIKRSETQWKVHNAMMQAMLPKIFGQEFETHSGRILRSLNIKRLRQEVMVVMARRQGKSYSVGMGCAALLLLCSDVRLAVFATGKRMAAALLDITKRMIEKAWDTGAIPRKGYEIVHANQEVFHLKGPDGTERVLNVMPGTAKVSLSLSFLLGSVICVCACVLYAKVSYARRRREGPKGKGYPSLFFFQLIPLQVTPWSAFQLAWRHLVLQKSPIPHTQVPTVTG